MRLYLASEDPPTLDSSAAQDAVSIAILDEITRPLLSLDKTLTPQPAAASALPTVSADGLTLTYSLRTDAVYSDGSPIVADDFVFSLQRLVDPRSAEPHPYAYLACPIVGVDDLVTDCGKIATAPTGADVDALLAKVGVSKTDDHTVVYNLSSPAAYFQTVTALWPFVPLKKAWVDTSPFGDAAGYLSSGPYIMSQWQHNSLIELAPNPNWYGDQKATTTIEYNIGGDPDAAFASYQQGNLDIVTVPGSQLRSVLDPSNPLNPQAVQLPQLSITYYDYANCGLPDKLDAKKCPNNDATTGKVSPTSDKDFRIALTEAIDKQQVIDLTHGGVGQIANTMVMPGIPGAQADYNPYPFNPEDAMTHLTTALTNLGVQDNDGDGAVTCKDLGTMPFGYNVNSGHEARVVNLVEQWRTNLGCNESNFDLVGVDFSTFLQQRLQGTYTISRDGWGADFPNAHNQLVGLFTCGGGNNDNQYCDKQVDDLWAQADVTSDPTAAAALYQQGEKTVVDDAAALWLYFGLATYLVQPYVQGLQTTSSDSENAGDRLYEYVTIAAH